MESEADDMNDRPSVGGRNRSSGLGLIGEIFDQQRGRAFGLPPPDYLDEPFVWLALTNYTTWIGGHRALTQVVGDHSAKMPIYTRKI